MSNVTVTDAENGRTFDVHIGDQVVATLEESPTTGFQWSIVHNDSSVLRLEDADFQTSGSGVGGGGERRFTFVAVRPGTVQLELKLWRDWEGERSTIKRFSVVINVS